MKKVLLLIAAVVLMAVPAMAGITTTKHNLSNWGTGSYKATAETEVCKFCHTPHNPSQRIPLWNRNNPAGGTFRVYSGSSTLNVAAADLNGLSSDSISLFCLSCHDGSTALGNVTRGGPITMAGSGVLGGPAAIGGDSEGLRNDHPVNFSMNVVYTNDNTIANPANITDLKFFNSSKTAGTYYVECATCHEVHGTGGFAKFLKKSNGSSALCLTCHQK